MVAQSLVELLYHDITPVVPVHGSLGASGDLAPLAHIALVLTSEGWVFDKEGGACAVAIVAGRTSRVRRSRPLRRRTGPDLFIATTIESARNFIAAPDLHTTVEAQSAPLA